MTRYWLIRYTSPSGRISLVIRSVRAVAADIADRLNDATLLETENLQEATALAAVFDVPQEIHRLGACP